MGKPGRQGGNGGVPGKGDAPKQGQQAALDRDLLPELVGYQLRRAQLAVFAHFMRHVGDGQVTPGQFGVLTLIAANPALNQSQLARALGIDRSSVVAVIDRLQQRGLVIRVPSVNDRRANMLRLSAEGERLLRRMKRAVRAHEASVLAELSPAERTGLMALLSRLTCSAQARLAGPEPASSAEDVST